MARGDAIEYGFATGRVMVLRSRLLGPAAFERLLDAPTFEDARRVLSDTHLGRFLDGVRTTSDVERAIDASLIDLFDDFLRRAELPAPVVAFFQAPYDFAALKSVLRARALGVEPEPVVNALGSVEADAFADPVALPGALGETACSLADATGPASAEAVDAAVDAALFAELTRLARASRIPVLQRLVARRADAANAKVLIRSAAAGRRTDAARAMLVPGGSWDANAAARLVGQPVVLAEAILKARVLTAPSAEDLLDLEKLDVYVEAASADIARQAAHGPIGPQPVLGYVLQRVAEASIVRTLLVGRLAGLPRDVLVPRVQGVAS
jgi:V/A-type H+-transporting ATPase subunit C